MTPSAPTPITPQATPLVSGQQFGKIFKLIVVAVVVVILASLGMDKCDKAKAEQKAAQEAARERNKPVELTLSCGGEKEYAPLPAGNRFVLTIDPMGENCWTPWIPFPEVKFRVPIYDGDAQGDLKTQLAARDGKVLEPIHISPREKPWNPRSDIKAIRYQNRGAEPVKVLVTLYW